MLLRTVLGTTLRRLREERGMRLVDVATRARLSVAYVSEVERGRKEASSEVLAALCGALDVPVSFVVREAGDRLTLVGQASGAARATVLELASTRPRTSSDDRPAPRRQELLRAA